MEFKRNGPNMAILTTRDGSEILFSYSEPVAVALPRPGGVLVTDRFFSRSTLAHIAAFKAGRQGITTPHDQILKITREA